MTIPAKLILPLLLLLGFVSACDSRTDVDTARPAKFGFQTSIPKSLMEEGHLAYQRYCTGCHGEAGDGLGEAAAFLSPRPRNFVNAAFKFSSTRSGQLPTDEDLKRTIRTGLRGSAMPSFPLLPERTVDALVAYVKTLSPKWQEREPAAQIPFVADPFKSVDDRATSIARGEAVYHGYSICWSCHPSYVPEAKINEYVQSFGGAPRTEFRGDLHIAEGKPNDEGELIYPPDFRRDFVRAGTSAEDLYRSIASGITGTAMPTWVDSIDIPGKKPGDPPLVSQQDLWAMAYYVKSLIEQRPALLKPGEFAVRPRPRPIYLHGAPPPVAEPATSQPADLEMDF
ncbi:MAG TPA: cytochrome c [Phycisphaerae bacterium]|nr:cytochrome c [Phycisphaerae bacterium]